MPLISIGELFEVAQQAFDEALGDVDAGVQPSGVAPPKFGCALLPLPADVAARVLELGRTIAEEDLAEDGREERIHLTAAHGFPGEVDASHVRRLLARAGSGPVRVRLGPITLFQQPDHDVVKIDVHGQDVHRLHRLLADNLPYQDRFPVYNPHVTIAYVLPGAGAKYVSTDHPLAGLEVSLPWLHFSDAARNETRLALGRSRWRSFRRALGDKRASLDRAQRAPIGELSLAQSDPDASRAPSVTLSRERQFADGGPRTAGATLRRNWGPADSYSDMEDWESVFRKAARQMPDKQGFQLYINPKAGKVWLSVGDWAESEAVEAAEKLLLKWVDESKLRVEAETGPPRKEAGWYCVSVPEGKFTAGQPTDNLDNCSEKSKPAECTCDYPDVTLRNGSGHAPGCACHRQWQATGGFTRKDGAAAPAAAAQSAGNQSTGGALVAYPGQGQLVPLRRPRLDWRKLRGWRQSDCGRPALPDGSLTLRASGHKDGDKWQTGAFYYKREGGKTSRITKAEYQGGTSGADRPREKPRPKDKAKPSGKPQPKPKAKVTLESVAAAAKAFLAKDTATPADASALVASIMALSMKEARELSAQLFPADTPKARAQKELAQKMADRALESVRGKAEKEKTPQPKPVDTGTARRETHATLAGRVEVVGSPGDATRALDALGVKDHSLLSQAAGGGQVQVAAGGGWRSLNLYSGDRSKGPLLSLSRTHHDAPTTAQMGHEHARLADLRPKQLDALRKLGVQSVIDQYRERLDLTQPAGGHEFTSEAEAEKWGLENYQSYHDPTARKKYHKGKGGISFHEYEVLQAYAGNGFVSINQMLRSKKTEQRSKVEQEWLDTIDGVMARNKTDRAVTTYRVASSPQLRATFDRALQGEVGETIADKAYVSTGLVQSTGPDRAYDRKVASAHKDAEKVMLQVHVPKGTPSLYMDNIWPMAEQELLLPRDSQFRVLGAREQGGKRWLDVEWVGHGDKEQQPQPKEAPAEKGDPQTKEASSPGEPAAPPGTDRVEAELRKIEADRYDPLHADGFDADELAADLKMKPADVQAVLDWLSSGSPEAKAALVRRRSAHDAQRKAREEQDARKKKEVEDVQRGAYNESALPTPADWKPVRSEADFVARVEKVLDAGAFGERVKVAPGATTQQLDRVAQALVAARKAGMRLPSRLVVGTPPKAYGLDAAHREATGAYGGQAFASLHENPRDGSAVLYVPPGAVDPKLAALHYASGRTSTPDPAHAVLHELMHYRHFVSKGRGSDDTPEAQEALASHRKAIVEEVGRQAAAAPAELVAEVAVGVLLGQKYSAGVMGAYRAAGGPDVYPAGHSYEQVPAGQRSRFMADRARG